MIGSPSAVSGSASYLSAAGPYECHASEATDMGSLRSITSGGDLAVQEKAKPSAEPMTMMVRICGSAKDRQLLRNASSIIPSVRERA